MHGRGAPGQRPAELHAGRPGRHRGQGVARARARRADATAASPSRTTSASPSTWRRPTCPRSRAASTCRSRWASWPPAGSIDAAAAGALTSSPASCRWPASCARCAARWPWRWRCAASTAPRTLVLPTDSAQRSGAGAAASTSARPTTCCEVVQSLRRATTAADAAARASRCRGAPAAALPDLRDVKGQAGAKRALEIAAAGGHSLLMVGPPGTGKSMLAQRLPGLLPPMDEDEALASAALQGLAARASTARAWASGRSARRTTRPARWRWSAAARRRGRARSRWRTAACCSSTSCRSSPRAALEALREPLESGRITISRAARQAAFPARFQLVAAMNPCPCGYLGAFAATGKACRCTPDRSRATRARLSGPLLDRIDLQVEVHAVKPEAADGPGRRRSLSRRGARAWRAARQRQLQRQGVPNAAIDAGAHRRTVRARRGRRALRRRPRRSGWAGRAAACTAR